MSDQVINIIYVSLLYLFVKVFVPHIVDGAARTPHQQGASTKQGEHPKIRKASGLRCQGDAPCTRKVEQPCS